MANSGNNTVPFGNIGNPFNTAEAEIKPDETVLK